MSGHIQTFQQLRDRLIVDGIAEVERVYVKGDPRRAGAIEGFELCRSLDSRDAFENVLRTRENRDSRRSLRHTEPTQEQIDAYWRQRYATLQVEWVLKCLLAAGWARPGERLSGRAVRKIAEVTGQ